MISLRNIPCILLAVTLVLSAPAPRLLRQHVKESVLEWKQELPDKHLILIRTLSGTNSPSDELNSRQVQVDVLPAASSNTQRNFFRLTFDASHKLIECTFGLLYAEYPDLLDLVRFSATTGSVPTYLENLSFKSASEFHRHCENLRQSAPISTMARYPRSTMSIMPGTLWCGKGNVATPERVYGSEIEADICCRTHDKCFENIQGLTTKWGYRNTSPVTISNCLCDDDFLACLENAGTEAAIRVGTLFFNVFRVPCFQRNQTSVCTLSREDGSCENFQELNEVTLYAPQRFVQSYRV